MPVTDCIALNDWMIMNNEFGRNQAWVLFEIAISFALGGEEDYGKTSRIVNAPEALLLESSCSIPCSLAEIPQAVKYW
jgi:hypothetical protein